MPHEFFLESICASHLSEKIAKNSNKHPKESKSVYYLCYETALMEARYIYFLYIYFYYNDMGMKKEGLLPFWNLIFRFLRIFKESKSPSTCLWILELINMLCSKYSPRDIIGDKRFRYEF